MCTETTDINFSQNLILSNKNNLSPNGVICYLILLTSTTRIELSPVSMVHDGNSKFDLKWHAVCPSFIVL